MTPSLRLLTVAISMAVAGLGSSGPVPASAEAATSPAPSQVVPAASHRNSALSSKLKNTTGTGTVSLTFDDGPDPRWTPRILTLLRKSKVKATFCLVGTRARAYPALVRAIVH